MSDAVKRQLPEVGDRIKVRVKNTRDWGKMLDSGELLFSFWDYSENNYRYYTMNSSALLKYNKEYVNNNDFAIKCTVEDEVSTTVDEKSGSFVVRNPRVVKV